MDQKCTLKTFFSGFIEDNPEGTLSKDKMKQMYQAVLSEKKASQFVEQIFEKFDKDGSGEIDFKVSKLKGPSHQKISSNV